MEDDLGALEDMHMDDGIYDDYNPMEDMDDGIYDDYYPMADMDDGIYDDYNPWQ